MGVPVERKVRRMFRADKVRSSFRIIPPRRARPDLKTKLKMPTLLKNSRISLILMPAHAKVFGNERQSPLGVGEATT